MKFVIYSIYFVFENTYNEKKTYFKNVCNLGSLPFSNFVSSLVSTEV